MNGQVTVPPDSVSVVIIDLVVGWVLCDEVLVTEIVVVEEEIDVEIMLLFSNDWSSIQRLQSSWLYGSVKFS